MWRRLDVALALHRCGAAAAAPSEPATAPRHTRIGRAVYTGANATMLYATAPYPLGPNSRVLDVGTGIGLLIPYLKARGVRQIVGCDLSQNMLAEARLRHPDVEHWHGDVLGFDRSRAGFDAIFCNAMFGNVWDQRAVLDHGAELAAPGGALVISHPMGAGFVDELRRRDPHMVLHSLPRAAGLGALTAGLPWRVEEFVEEPEFYLAVLARIGPKVRRDGPAAACRPFCIARFSWPGRWLRARPSRACTWRGSHRAADCSALMVSRARESLP